MVELAPKYGTFCVLCVYLKPIGDQLSILYSSTWHLSCVSSLLITVLIYHSGALLLALEHRYYGSSNPFGTDVSTDNLAWLNSEQAIGDIANFHRYIRLEEVDNKEAFHTIPYRLVSSIPWPRLTNGSHSVVRILECLQLCPD